MKKIFQWKKFKNSIGEPPWNYYFLQNLEEKEYPMYLAKLFYLNTGEKLPLADGVIDKRRCKTFNQKLQWLKLYGVTHLMRDCTDKVKVRDYVKERIGEEYLKPVLQIIGTCHSENVENQNGNSVDFQVVQNLKEKLKEEKMLKHACINDEIQNEKINKTAVQHDRPLGALCPNVINKNDVSTYFLKSALQIIPNESHETMRCHCEQTNDHLMSAWQSTLKSEHTMDCRADNKMPLSARNDGEPFEVTTYFNQIDFDKLPNSFVIKTNHGCKWQYIIKDKKEFLQNKQLFEFVKKNMTGWLEQDYSLWGGFELQYKGIEPKILIEPFMRDETGTSYEEIHVYCFYAQPKYIVKVIEKTKNFITVYNEKLNITDDIFCSKEEKQELEADKTIKQTFELSKILSKDFIFVRTDWSIYKNKPYFQELTFTPHSGFHYFTNKKYNLKLGKFINL